MSGRFPGGGHGNPLQHSCLENAMDTGACGLQSIVIKNQTQWKRLNMHPHIYLQREYVRYIFNVCTYSTYIYTYTREKELRPIIPFVF